MTSSLINHIRVFTSLLFSFEVVFGFCTILLTILTFANPNYDEIEMNFNVFILPNSDPTECLGIKSLGYLSPNHVSSLKLRGIEIQECQWF